MQPIQDPPLSLFNMKCVSHKQYPKQDPRVLHICTNTNIKKCAGMLSAGPECLMFLGRRESTGRGSALYAGLHKPSQFPGSRVFPRQNTHWLLQHLNYGLFPFYSTFNWCRPSLVSQHFPARVTETWARGRKNVPLPPDLKEDWRPSLLFSLVLQYKNHLRQFSKLNTPKQQIKDNLMYKRQKTHGCCFLSRQTA